MTQWCASFIFLRRCSWKSERVLVECGCGWRLLSPFCRKCCLSSIQITHFHMIVPGKLKAGRKTEREEGKENVCYFLGSDATRSRRPGVGVSRRMGSAQSGPSPEPCPYKRLTWNRTQASQGSFLVSQKPWLSWRWPWRLFQL